MKKTFLKETSVRLTNETLNPLTAALTIGDQLIPFYELTLCMKVGYEVTITAVVPASQIDIKALAKNTELVIVQPKGKS